MNSVSLGKVTFTGNLRWRAAMGVVAMLLPLSFASGQGENWEPLEADVPVKCKTCPPSIRTGNSADTLTGMAKKLAPGAGTSRPPQPPPPAPGYFMPSATPAMGPSSHPLPLVGMGISSLYLSGPDVSIGGGFNPRGMTAAHLTLPFGSIVQVCRTDQPDLCVEVCINDRGPYTGKRVLDLTGGSYDALAGPNATPAEKSELRKKGLINVKIFSVRPPPPTPDLDAQKRQARVICAPYSGRPAVAVRR